MRPRALDPTAVDTPRPSASRATVEALAKATEQQARRSTPGVEDIVSYAAAQNADDAAHREIVGPLLAGGPASGLVVVDGWVLGQWGDPTRPEMTYSVTKSVISLVAGTAFDDGLLVLDRPVAADVDLDEFSAEPADRITWRHLLEQTSGWNGELWGKPTGIDAQSNSWDGSAPPGAGPGEGWTYNDVRVNLLCLALTSLLGAPLPEVLADRVMRPIGASDTWSWHGYHNSVLPDDRELVVVSGGGHWGGGLWINAEDLALLGELVRCRGRYAHQQLVSRTWLDLSWTPSARRQDYGLLWWLNDHLTVIPEAPDTGRVARGNARRHLLWIDPPRQLVVAAHWSDDIGQLLSQVSDVLRPN